MKHLISLQDFTAQEVTEILDRADDLKRRFLTYERPAVLSGTMLSQIFDKPSLRTRMSFETAIVHLGGSGTFMTSAEAGLNGRESLEDVARVLSSYVDVITLRTFSHQSIVDFAKHSSCPVINALSDELHPCQALADVMTMRELFGADLSAHRLVYVGDGNNVAASLCNAAALLDIPITICTPSGYELPETFQAGFAERFPDFEIVHTNDARKAVSDASVIYTDVWASMGQEKESVARNKAFSDYQVNRKLLAAAPKECRFLHCLPAKRGLEVTDEVMESPNSAVFQQAENRMHLAKGLFHWLLVK
jgi:ornithine carbamoyltransferase